jgi:hypothetical protein
MDANKIIIIIKRVGINVNEMVKWRRIVRILWRKQK